MSLKFIQDFEDLFEGLNFLLQALLDSFWLNFKAECEGEDMESVLLSFIVVLLDILEEFVLCCNICIVLVMVGHLDKVV